MFPKWIPVLTCTLFVLSGVHSSTGIALDRVGPPQLAIETSPVLLMEHDTLNLTCTGRYKLDWRYPYGIERTRTLERHHPCTPSTRSLNCRHRSTLTIANVDIRDTGMFQCLYRRYDMRINNETAVNTYIYVTSNERLFVPAESTQYKIYGGQPFVLPCRTTSPHVNVILVHQHTGRVVKDVHRYDSMSGFHISANHHNISGNVCCQGTLEHNVDTSCFHLIFQEEAPSLAPRVSVNKAEVLEGWEGFNVSCEVWAPRGSVEALSWHYPAQALVDHNSSNYQIMMEDARDTSERGSGSMRRKYISTLQVIRASSYDNGTYTCVATNFWDSFTAETSINVLGAGHLNGIGSPHIHTPTSEIVMRENTTLDITCTGGFMLEWVYPEVVHARVLLVSTACPTCHHSARFTSTLTVRSLEPQDTGQFQCIYSRYVKHVNPATAAAVYVFVAANDAQLHRDGPPVMHVNTSEIVLAEKHNLELRCTGSSPLEWTYPNTATHRVSQKTIGCPSCPLALRYCSTLRVTNLTFLDTGYYRCFYSRHSDRLSNETTAEVYTYVSSNDRTRFFTNDSSFYSIVVISGNPVTIPCTVTDPHINVTLLAERKVFSGPGSGITYDPRVGFQIPANKTNYQIMMTCQAQKGDVIQEKYIILSYEVRATLPVPKAYSPIEVIKGETFNVTCVVEAPLGVNIAWQWDYPALAHHHNPHNYHKEKSSQEVQVSMEGSRHMRAYREFVGTLIVSQASLIDNGTYACTAVNNKGKGNTTTQVIIWEESYIVMTPRCDDVIYMTKGAPRGKISVYLKYFPEADFTWFKDGAELDALDPRLYKSRIKQDTALVRLTHITDEHAGNYTLVAYNGDIERSITVQVVINVRPVLTISISDQMTDHVLFYNTKTYIFNCTATGRPISQVSWQWLECASLDDSCLSARQKREGEWKVIPPRLASSNMSAIAIDASLINTPRMLRCQANSTQFDPVIKDQIFFPTDVERGLTIVNPYDDPVLPAGNITLVCKSSYLFRHVRWYLTRRNQTRPLRPREGHVNITTYQEELSRVSELHLHNVGLSDVGVYVCRATGLLNRKEVTRDAMTTITIRDLHAPEMVIGLESREVNKNSKEFVLQCEAKGEPAPSFAWFKDDHPLETLISREQMPSGNSVSYLRRTRINVADSGLYRCVASNQAGEVNSSAIITVFEKPYMKVKESVMLVAMGTSVNITCHDGGNPRPTVAWYYQSEEADSKPIALPATMFNDTEGILVIPDVGRDQEGSYTCNATNRLGSGSRTVNLKLDLHSVPQQVRAGVGRRNTVLGVVAVLIVIVIALIILIIRIRKMRPKYIAGGEDMLLPISIGQYNDLLDICEHLPYDSKWEFPRERLKIGPVIGRGAFGRVMKASAFGIDKVDTCTTVAVKMLKEDAMDSEKKALMTELKMLIHIGPHLNIVNLLGACTKKDLFIISEFCPFGNLSDYLKSKRKNYVAEPSLLAPLPMEPVDRSSRTSSRSAEGSVGPGGSMMEVGDDDVFDYMEKEVPLSLKDLICYSYQVARGMEFLTSKKCIHRDLAARNVLLAENNIVKICDFGLARDIYSDPDYVTQTGGRLPIKWMAPESIFDKVFTIYSDVWSFGVFMWEAFALGGSPYPGVVVDEEFYNRLKSGYRMCAPDYAPQEIYHMMLDCWHTEPKERPHFSELVHKLGDQLAANVKQDYLDLDAAYDEEVAARPISFYEETAETTATEQVMLAEEALEAEGDISLPSTSGYQQAHPSTSTYQLEEETPVSSSLETRPRSSIHASLTDLSSSDPCTEDVSDDAASGTKTTSISSSTTRQHIHRHNSLSALDSLQQTMTDRVFHHHHHHHHHRHRGNNSTSKSEESVSSDSSSGFRSGGYGSDGNDEPPPEYSKVMQVAVQF